MSVFTYHSPSWTRFLFCNIHATQLSSDQLCCHLLSRQYTYGFGYSTIIGYSTMRYSIDEIYDGLFEWGHRCIYKQIVILSRYIFHSCCCFLLPKSFFLYPPHYIDSSMLYDQSILQDIYLIYGYILEYGKVMRDDDDTILIAIKSLE